MKDAKLRKTCYHYVDGTAYKKYACPRCLGEGYYYDVKIDEQGLVEEVIGADKLRQELEKITLTLKGSNKFHPQYGTLLDLAAQKGVEKGIRRDQIKQDLIAAVQYLRVLQQLELEKGAVLTEEELISSLERIEVIGHTETKGRIV